jgi:CRP/FNR family transcriptional regulator, anaerobic regulatory protein
MAATLDDPAYHPQGKCDCKFCPLSECGVMPDVSTLFPAEMLSTMLHQVIAKGRRLYNRLDSADHIYILHDGVVKLEQRLPTGEHRILRLLRKGDISGIESITAPRYQHDATALTEIHICKIPADFALGLTYRNQQLLRSLLDKWQQALVTTETWLTRLSTGPSRYRVVRMLIWLAENSPEQDFFLPVRKDIGLMLGLTTETASRIIAELRRDKQLRLLGGGRALADVPALRAIIKETPEEPMA